MKGRGGVLELGLALFTLSCGGFEMPPPDAMNGDAGATGAAEAELPGQDDCQRDFVEPLMSFLDQHAAGYLAWSWNVQGECRPKTTEDKGNPWPLIGRLDTAEPSSAYAQAFRDHVLDMTQ